MFNARLLQVLLLFLCSVAVVDAKDPGAVLGPGSMTCKEYVTSFDRGEKAREANELFLTWLQGYFSARNTIDPNHILTVGGTVSSTTLASMLADQCRDERLQPVMLFVGALELYEKLRQKGL